MREMGVSKETGMSWIEIEKKVQSFVVGDKMHAQSGNIYGLQIRGSFSITWIKMGRESHWFNTTQIFLIFFVQSNNLSM